MSRSIFGWSLPPGCGSLPGENESEICQVCGLDPDKCICPACPECGEHGDPHCYNPKSPYFHGMVANKEQTDSLAEMEKKWAEWNRDPDPVPDVECSGCLDEGCPDCWPGRIV